ncbi:hypothetical protein LL037_25490 (plasmid) [Clostridium estertheticum]|uniref:Uncharacterized protein n=1 Tax=Clostridium estertheticum TaxID=238834 RepID=A0AA47EN70_9CLOT|nr:hypothetical protein [Clostridium estertheticum]MBU3158090.1 hypothetical protein [Clostridium estertheticum]MBU3201995.1 hypothetical protein [Clostridium estertheticum]WAG63329.1 hypothetical protein LL038_25520 [Clostridium estertheticum]WAG68234.1 hypothetical protein LL037_25490 [Clostridium estertheticum]
MLKNKKKFKSISMLLSAFIIAAPMVPTIASAKGISGTPVKSISISSVQKFAPSDNAIKFTQKMFDSGLIKEFSVDTKGNLVLNNTYDNLKSKYNLDSSSIQILKSMIANGQKGKVSTSTIFDTSAISVSNGNVKFTNSDVNAFLFAAAEIGPSAVFAALDAMATVTGGPVATIVVSVLAVIGLPSLKSLTYSIIQAEANNQGVYIGVSWNGVFPNIVSGTW